MGNLANYESSEIGKQRMEILRGHAKTADEIVRKMYALAVEYHNFRESLDISEIDDIDYCDKSLTHMSGELKVILDALAPAQKKWLDLVLEQLGFKAV